MKPDLISVIVPVYNIRDYISACLDSIAAQTYENTEIICVDDGSTDGSGEILDMYGQKDPRFRIIHQDNAGVTGARLNGVAAAKGAWIGFVDGDDYVEPEMYTHLIENALKYDADISHCGYQMVFPDRVDYYCNTGRRAEQAGRDAFREVLHGSYEPGLWNKLYRQALFTDLLENDRIDRSIRINEDLLMNYYLFRQADKTVYEDVCLYHYQIRKGSAATSYGNTNRLTDPIRVRRILMRETEDDPKLHTLAFQGYVRQMLRVAIMNEKKHGPETIGIIQQTRQELKETIPQIRRDREFPPILKKQAILACSAPTLYRRIHDYYGELTGIKHKYDIKRSK